MLKKGGFIMSGKRNRYRNFERFIVLCLILATILFFAYLSAAGVGNIALKVIYAILAVGISSFCLWTLYQRNELRRRRSFWMSVWSVAIVICILTSIILNFPSPNIYT